MEHVALLGLSQEVREYAGPHSDEAVNPKRQAGLASFIKLALGPTPRENVRTLKLKVELLGDGELLIHDFELGNMSNCTSGEPHLCHCRLVTEPPHQL